MSLLPKDCCVLNGGSGAWAFEPLANQLSEVLGVDVSVEPRRYNYLLHVPDFGQTIPGNLFIPFEAIQLAGDKRQLAAIFNQKGVPSPITRLIDNFGEVLSFIKAHPETGWCLKYPTSCGASGHRMLTPTCAEPPNWPRPFIVQEFIQMEKPEVYRTYCAAGELFGWVVRRFPEGVKNSPWVAHARGARYASLGEPPVAAMATARSALAAANLINSFGCVDLLCRPASEWLALEVGTDGLFNHVDRDLSDLNMENKINQEIAKSFWQAAEKLA